METRVNKVLRKITYDIYQARPSVFPNMRTNYRIEHVNGGLLCDLWFLTSGCIHDTQGGCVMCNYGKSCGNNNRDEIVEELKNIVDKLPWEFEDFLLTPSGSMLDEREVPKEMRDKLLTILKKVRAKRFIVETRADTITDAGLEFVKKAIPGSEKYIEIGLESSDDWVLKHCVNKNSTFDQFCKAVKKIHERDILVTANIGLGIPFMSEKASIHLTVQSIRDAFDAGADCVVLFPYHIKHGTLLDVMYQMGLYREVSLWSLVDVLCQFSAKERENIQISWYKDYFGEERSFIYRSPSTCPSCGKQVMQYLDQYRERQDPECIQRLEEVDCSCRIAWRKRIESETEEISFALVERAYRSLAERYGISDSTCEQEIEQMYHEFLRR